jgi:hypothetical protein
MTQSNFDYIDSDSDDEEENKFKDKFSVVLSIIDTSLYCDITIKLTLAPSDVLMLSNPIGTLATLTAATNGETGIAFTAGSSAASTASQGTGYTLTNIGFQITCYDMPASYYQAVASVLEAGSVFKLYYPNYKLYYPKKLQIILSSNYTILKNQTYVQFLTEVKNRFF